MIYLPAALFWAALLIAYGSAGRRRQAATLVAVAATGWALLLLVQPPLMAWAIGPLAATLLLPRGPRVNATFEGLTRRAITVAAAFLVAIFLASRLPIGENPILLSAVPWFLVALGAAWFCSPIDQLERLQGQALMIAGLAAVILSAVPAGGLTAAAAGGMALMPVAGERLRIPGSLRRGTAVALLALAAAALLAALVPTIGSAALGDIGLNFSGPVLLAVAIILIAGALVSPLGTEWAALLGVLALTAATPSLRWSALAALLAVATVLERRHERPAWIGLGGLAATPVLQSLAASTWGPRVQVAAIGLGLILVLFAARVGMLRVLMLPATVLLTMVSIGSLTAGNLVRLQWIAVGGAVFLAAYALLDMLLDRGGGAILRDPLLMGLLLLALSARDPLGLGELAVVLLLIDLALTTSGASGVAAGGRIGRLVVLARSNWPPSVSFAGAVLAVIAALQAALVLGLLAAILLGSLRLAPLLDDQRLAAAGERPRSALRWIAPLASLAGGFAPALLLRLLRL